MHISSTDMTKVTMVTVLSLLILIGCNSSAQTKPEADHLANGSLYYTIATAIYYRTHRLYRVHCRHTPLYYGTRIPYY